ncbi:MAG: amino acid adenylation domain-containing protein, partial [Burkholderiales bacterium]|nr:amino acid adenylation domain-containing protein [Burkholderiales bacterium]
MNKSDQSLEQLRQAILQQRLQKRIKALDEDAGTKRIDAADRSQPLPLSFAQQRLWFIDQLDHAGGAAYHMPAAFRLHGRLDRTALRAALDRIVARHEILRTTFTSTDGTPYQHIAEEGAGFTLLEHDLSHLHGAEQAVMVDAISLDEAAQPFDLSVGPLIRGQLLRLRDDEHILLVTQHHIVSDGWSIGLIVQEFSALYNAFCQQQPDPLPKLAVQYADYAVWQRNWLQGDTLENQVSFWKSFLAGAPELLALPTDRARPPVQSYAGAAFAFSLSTELSAQLKALSQRHGVTLFMTLMAGWALLLSRMSGQEDLVVGTPVANRQRGEVGQLLGFFANTLALRVNLEANPTVAELLAQVRTHTLQASEHQDLPFEQVVEALQPVRTMSYSPLFQVVMSLEQSPRSHELDLAGLNISPIQQRHDFAQFDINLSLVETEQAIGGTLRYATDLFDEASIARMARYFETVLAGMAADAAQRVAHLPLADAPARAQVLTGFNDTQRSYPSDGLIHQLFEQQAAQNPEALAAVCGPHRLSYEALNQRANRIAHRLIARGVKPDDRVAICADRGIDLVAGLLGILKAGGAYVPLDPSYPAERIDYMLADSAPVAILTQSHLRSVFDHAGDASILMLDDATLGQEASSNPDRSIVGQTSRHLAYIIYTSGSTGQPKGVMVEHRNVLRLVINNPFAEVTASDCVAQCANVAFDASTWEIWAALLNGARLQVIPQDTVLDPAQLRHALADGGVTALWLTVGLFNEYVEALGASLAQLRYLLIGGDALDPRVIARFFASGHAPTHLINGYGPTETTTFAATHDIRPPVVEGRSIPIGRPIANTQIYLLDVAGQPVPIGVPGEIHIAGDGVSRGYLNRPELTAERFVRDPFSPHANARMYKTGDLGRWTAEGTIEFLGRNDFQVKIRGFRIELGEIEAKLASHAGLRDVVVIAREDNPGEKRLVAYYTHDAETDADTISAASLRAHLATHLPEYMLPSAYVRLDALPLTSNGKLDRRALPQPDGASSASREYEAPRGPVEEAVAQVWRDLLKVDRIGRGDHFFQLGGHSLMAVQLTSRLRDAIGIELALRDLFA